MTMRDRRWRRSSRSSASARMAMISLAAVMTKPEERLLSSRCFLSGAVRSDDDARQALAQIFTVLGEREDGHDLAGGGDDEAGGAVAVVTVFLVRGGPI